MDYAVIIAAFQSERTIARAVKSALEQDLAPAEIIVVNDGSRDLTSARVPNAPTVQLLEQENAGPAAARNTAIRASSCEILVLLDADDYWESSRLRRIDQVFREQPQYDLVTTDAWRMSSDGHKRPWYTAPFPPPAQQATQILRKNFMYASAAFRREAWLRVGGFDETVHPASDYEFWIRLILSGSLAGFVDEPLAYYVESPASVVTNRARLFQGVLAILSSIESKFELTKAQMEAISLQREELKNSLSVALAVRAIAEGRDDRWRLSLAALSNSRVPVRVRLAILARAVRANRRNRG